ncbi:MAG: coenzyme F420-0:L-glutamate ligase [Candidatus Bathyarchaeia archaeon]
MARPSPVTLTPVRLPLAKQGQNLNELVERALHNQNTCLRNGDVLAVASKVVSLCENRILRLDTVRVSTRAKRLSERWQIDRRLTSIVLQEADLVLGGTRGFLLTVKDGILTANAGVDLKNSPHGTLTLWPKNADQSAARLRRHLEHKAAIRLGVEIVDSRVTALRLGTVGLAIGVSGFEPIRDYRAKPDLYGRKVKVTQSNIADDLAAAAHMLMGETRERVGTVLVRNAPVRFERLNGSVHAKLRPERCLISNGLGRFR